MENLYNYIFWYNPYEQLWYAINRDTELAFFNGSRDKAVFYKSTKIATLVELLSKDGALQKLLTSK